MALYMTQTKVELREVVLRHKPPEMLEISPKGTVPVLQLATGEVIEESLDIMHWALAQGEEGTPFLACDSAAQMALIADMDSVFKAHLDRYKYPGRYLEEPQKDYRALGLAWIEAHVSTRLKETPHLFGTTVSFADIAIFPFLRQFAHTDPDWFYQTVTPQTGRWLKSHIASAAFEAIMAKYPNWQVGEPGIEFPSYHDNKTA